MKKLFGIILLILLTAFSFSCGAQNTEELSFVVPDGAPALSVAKYINDKESFGLNKNAIYKVVSSSLIGNFLGQGNADLIVVPINAASKLYNANKSDPYKMVSVLTHGNLYLTSGKEITLESLKGQVVGVIGQGLVPDLTFRAVLSKYNLESEVSDTAVSEKVAIRYFDSAPSLISMLKTNKIEIGLLPEPAVTTLYKMDSRFTFRLDLQRLYSGDENGYPQAVFMAKTSVIKKYPSLIENIENSFNDNVEWVKNNPALAVTAVNGCLAEGVTPSLSESAINKSVIINCKIFYEKSSLAKQSVNKYLEEIIRIEKTSAKTVDDNFFM